MKNQKDSIQNKLNAHIDGQLDSQQREEVLELMENDPELKGEICDLYRIKDLVQTAYPLNEFQHNYSANKNNFSILYKVASILVAFVLTLSAGYMMRDSNVLTKLDGIAIADIKPQNNKVIVFISSSKPEKFKKALFKAEELAKKFQYNGGKVFVVASAEGIDLLRSSTSPHSQRINKLAALYSSLDFVACNNTLYQYEKAGKPIELIDSAKVAPSAVEFVVNHLQKGWRYIAI
jgi:intracellular sulfur oxidation DsrE/DsrF family protein